MIRETIARMIDFIALLVFILCVLLMLLHTIISLIVDTIMDMISAIPKKKKRRMNK